MPNAIQILQTVGFARWARKEGLSAQALRATVSEIEDGLIDAYLGDRVVKKRIGLDGRGKRGGLRTILAFQMHDRAIFIYGFAKNQRDNISPKELQALRRLGLCLLQYDQDALNIAVANQELIEVPNENP
jgi:hypothetical protein